MRLALAAELDGGGHSAFAAFASAFANKKHGLDCAIEDLVDCMNYDHDLAIDICDILNDQNTDTFDKSDFLAAMAAMKKEDTSWKNPLTE